jgi:PilZ domain-containing protein
MSQAERRGFERVEYAVGSGDRPVFLSGGGAFEVVDCAERGIRYVADRLPEVGSDVRGTIRFPDGPEVPVEGVVVRAGGDGVAVNFTQLWIDKEVIERERRRVRGSGHFAR